MDYHARLQELKEKAQQLESRLSLWRAQSDRYSHLRLSSFVLASLASGSTLLAAGGWLWLVVTPAALLPFAIMVYRHRRVDESIVQYEIRLKLTNSHIARMTLDWQRIPAAIPTPPDLEHPFAADLDLLGNPSLHQLMDTAVSREGSQRLAAWLLETSPKPARVIARQACVRELAGLPGFRDDLILNATLAVEKSAEKWPGKRLLDWIEGQPAEVTSARRALLLLVPLAFANIVLGILNAVAILPAWWAITWIMYAGLSLTQLRKHANLFHDAFFLRDGLVRLSSVFNFLESYEYAGAPHIGALCAPFLDSKNQPSSRLREVSRIVAAIGLQRNQVLWITVNALMPWDIYAAFKMSHASRELALLLPEWLDVWYELEALASLANFAYLNPAATFPQLMASDAGQRDCLFAARALGHPLIWDGERICNDFVVRKLGTINIITGSNMAGKSTFLRTVALKIMRLAGLPAGDES
jgi:hypothetical protein